MPVMFSVIVPAAGPYPTGILINNGAGYAKGTTAAMTTDGGNASHAFPIGAVVMAKDVNARSDPTRVLGNATANGATNVRIAGGGGTKFALTDNAELYSTDSAALAFKLISERLAAIGVPLSPQAGIQCSDDGRGNLIYTYFDGN